MATSARRAGRVTRGWRVGPGGGRDRGAPLAPVRAGHPPHIAAAAHEDRLRNTSHGLARALRGLGTGALPSLWDRLGEVSIPVTLVVGERDAKFRDVASEMAPLHGVPVEVVVVP